MARFDTYFRNEGFEIILYLFVVLSGFLLATFGGFSLRGFEESFAGSIIVQSYLGTNLVYLSLLPIAIGLIIFPIFALLYLRKGEHPATQTPKKWYQHLLSVSLIYAPENGILYQTTRSRYVKNFYIIFMSSLLLFSLIGILQLNNPILNVFGVPNAPQQITIASDIIFGSVIPTITENGNILFIFFLLLGILTIFTSRIRDRNTALGTFFAMGFLICAICGFLWASYHIIVYGNSDANLLATFIFGFSGTLLTLMTGTIVPFGIWHLTNNAFIKISAIASPNLFPILLGIWFVVLVLFILSLVFFKK